MKLLFDHNLSPHLVERLASLYPDTSHVALVGLDRASERFIEDPETGLCKGPWGYLRRPFRPAPPDVTMLFDTLDTHLLFQPFLHQWRA